MEAMCLALAIYFEARSEPLPGRIAVGNVVMNRVDDDRWPDTICGVVKQRNQFRFYWDGLEEIIDEPDAWEDAEKVAFRILENWDGYRNPDPKWYHRYDVNPSWNKNLAKLYQIGDHIFWGDNG